MSNIRVNLDTLKTAIEDVTQRYANNKYIVLNNGDLKASSIRSGKLSLGQLADIVKNFVDSNQLKSTDDFEKVRTGLGKIIEQSTNSMRSWKFLILNFLTLGIYRVKFQKALTILNTHLKKVEDKVLDLKKQEQDEEMIKGMCEINDLKKQSFQLENEITSLEKELDTCVIINKNIPEICECRYKINEINKEIIEGDKIIKEKEEKIEEIKKKKKIVLAMPTSYATAQDFDNTLKAANQELEYAKNQNEYNSSWIPRTIDGYRHIERKLKAEFPTSSIETIDDALEIPSKIEEFKSKIEEKKAEIKKILEKITSIENTKNEIILNRAFLNVKIK